MVGVGAFVQPFTLTDGEALVEPDAEPTATSRASAWTATRRPTPRVAGDVAAR